MDRFIEVFSCCYIFQRQHLKSNMDRFIAVISYGMCFIPLEFKIQYGQIYSGLLVLIFCSFLHLKSNMDRFIASGFLQPTYYQSVFKIQYGQIYSVLPLQNFAFTSGFKIQYGQIYSGKIQQSSSYVYYLKSNMDRFIDPCNDEILYGGEI